MRNILLAVTGLNPQVITETLFALHQNLQQVDAVHVITTRDGKERIYGELLSGKSGHYYRYLEEYGISPSGIDFDYRNIHVIKDEHGRELPDILTEADNECLLELCLDLTFRFTREPNNAVFFSIAGGRKTMSSCLTLAAQIYGRPQDRIYHVLVSPEFESNRDFFYPPRKSKAIELRDEHGNPYFKETRYAQVNLVPVPFVSVRDRLAPALLSEPRDPGTLLSSLVREEAAVLKVNLPARKLIYKDLELDMMPAWMALYAFFITRKQECAIESETCGRCTDCFLDIQEIFARQDRLTDLYRRITRDRPIAEMSDTGITQLNSENFNAYKAKIKDKLRERFGYYALKDLEIASLGKRPNTRYGIKMDKSRIEIVY
ncbi:MAG: TIGR02584 family CRISPR-associated protein [Deltaproteobacteria bacterium]|nr:TIGR02584 family CRISPR-associated protein [Deltaproteobacteria bacterium]MBW2065534.1 TIGR02584 family CRISPR-associated protein [Deltaproteobacteria bacterium]